MEMLAAVEGTKKRPANQEAVSLDDLFERQALSEAFLVSIDTEGSDALVLEGMQRLLQQGRVAFLEVSNTITLTLTPNPYPNPYPVTPTLTP